MVCLLPPQGRPEPPVPLADFLDTLNGVPYGAYAMDMNRTILFWNRSAERITGHKQAQVIGRQCYEVLFGIPEQPVAPNCTGGCLTLALAEAERIAPAAHVRMRCASGKRIRVAVMTLIVPETATEPHVLLHMFHEEARQPGPWKESSAVRRSRKLSRRANSQANEGIGRTNPLTLREREVVKLLTEGYDTGAIAKRLHLSTHTVRNYVRNAREKLDAPSRLALVLAAQRLGLL